MHEDKSFYINEEIQRNISITASDYMLLILFRFLLLSLTSEAFNVTLFKSHIFNYYNYIRWVHNAPPLVEDKTLENGAYYWAYYLSTYPSPQCLHHNQAGGQNIYFTWHPQEISEYDLARATIQAFYSEKRYYDYSRPNFNHAASHFTNLIWKSTQRIGIAEFNKNVLPPKQVFDI
ncbi:hypothetical protein PRIPAC_80195 [Pristionchus pacificus]|uniref:SCP domain-containing protein n=1 Tax=Pristionchus pacificus TaxID=54126 RepID=A0A2A6C264_PRIPA|nr:hypothetical protein PRIPAC_80195 [Pristionchus pacificus]|eukprot:PDM72255.1 hypothetical protein PRIPAC_38689 [Pristionchus pacificus]